MTPRTFSARALTESGMTVGIAVILSLIGVYVPLLSTVALLAWPAPIAFLGVRHGIRWSSMAVAATMAILMMTIGPVLASGIGLLFGSMGIALGEGYRRRWSAGRLMLVTMTVFLFGFGMQFFLSLYVMGVNIFELYQQTMAQATNQAFHTLDSMGYNSVELAQAKEAYLAQQAQIKQLMPFVVVSAGVVMAYLNILISRAVLRRLRVDIPPFPPVAEWEMPRSVLYLYVAAILIGYFGAEWGGSAEIVTTNIKVGCMYLLWVQGIAVLFWWVRRFPQWKWLRWVGLVLSVFVPMVMAMMFFAGLIDMAINYRMRRDYR